MTIEIDESERQFVLLALALIGLARPGFEQYARGIGAKLEGESMYDSFRDSNRDRPAPLPGNCLSPLSCRGPL